MGKTFGHIAPSVRATVGWTWAPLLLFGSAAIGCNGKSPPRAVSVVASDASPDAPVTVPPAGNLDCSADAADWPMWGQNVCNTNSQANAGGISPSAVGTLGVKWTYDAAGDVSATPTVVGGGVYVPDWGGNINRLDLDAASHDRRDRKSTPLNSSHQIISYAPFCLP